MDRLAAMDAFVRVIDTGSFSAAARELRVQQPAVSKTIAQLEEWLGVRLLLRSTRAVSLTEAGQRFYDRSRETLDVAEAAASAARTSSVSLKGRVRVSACPCFARLMVIPRLPELLARHPELEVDLLLDERDLDLTDERIDVALQISAAGAHASTVRKLAESPRVVFATPGYLARHGTPSRPRELVEHETILFTRETDERGLTFRRGAGEEEHVVPRGRLRLSSAEGVRAAVLADMGLAVGCEWLFRAELAAGAVQVVLPEWQLPPVAISAVFSSGRLASSKAREFVSFVEACLADRRAPASLPEHSRAE